MSISAPFIRRPIGTSLMAAALLLSGILAFTFLPVSSLPRVDFPVISVGAACQVRTRRRWHRRWQRRSSANSDASRV